MSKFKNPLRGTLKPKGFKPVSSQVDFAALEEEILKFWKEHKIFEKSVESRPEDKKWTFLDGPPFVTGTPHYGSLLSSIPKDLFGRYWTMKGYRVRRVWGWDGHGLPIENKVEAQLNVKRKRDIEEKVGIKRFVDECLRYVNDVSADWEWYIDHIGRWVDFKNAYKTWDLPYMESVMWVFKQMYDKGYIYKGLRVLLFCPHCSTPISNFEVAMDPDNYKDVTGPATIYKYELKDSPQTFILAWSTTPWNKIATPALAINAKLRYVKVKQGGEDYILAKSTLKMLKPDMPYEILEEFSGEKLIGKEFIPHYDFYEIEPGKRAFVIIGGDFVTAEEGTGVVTIAAYGEEDLKVMQEENIQIVQHVDDEGIIKDDVPLFGGMYYLDSNLAVNEDLRKRSLIYDEKDYVHSVAHCWRCGTRLYYAPKDAWYVDIQKLKPKLFKNNEPVNWFPKHFKYGRFAKSMEAAPDWNISRNRYWGSPVPVWICECGEQIAPGSIKELEDLSGRKITNLHKPDIDEVEIPCKKCNKSARRVPEVLDSWVEAGSASFGERHFPFNQAEKLEDFFPPDFVAEYTGQIRAWFYVLHVIATALYDAPPFKNVLVEGVLLGTDGRKMSKNYGNYPDPKELLQKYGGDALRIYLISSPLMKGEDINFSNDGVPEAVRGFLLILWNSYKYFVDYAIVHNWNCELEGGDKNSLSVLDKWILAKLTRLVLGTKKAYENYDTPTAIKLLREFTVGDLSTWYIRRNRDRVSGSENPVDRNTALSVLYGVLVAFVKLLAPLAPFVSEEIYKNLTRDESVHLTDFPQGDESLIDDKLIKNMEVVRRLAELGHAQRKEAGIKLRQPLAALKYYGAVQLDKELEQVLADELNVKQVEYKQNLAPDGTNGAFGTKQSLRSEDLEKPSDAEVSLRLDTKITPKLQREGEVRELIRQIQQMRKEQGLTLADKSEVEAPSWPKEFEEQILKSTASVKISKGEDLKVHKI